MSKREIMEFSLALGAVGTAVIGAVLIEPAVIGAGAVAAAAASIMRFNDQRTGAVKQSR